MEKKTALNEKKGKKKKKKKNHEVNWEKTKIMTLFAMVICLSGNDVQTVRPYVSCIIVNKTIL